MWLELRAVFWLLVGLLVLLLFVVANAVMAFVDSGLGWVGREINAAFDERFGDW
jgi:hypothetical protein